MTFFSSIKRALVIQLRVILSLVLREARATFGSLGLGYIWIIVTPTAGTTILAALFSLVGRQPPFGSSLFLFFATGMLTLQFFTALSSKLMHVFVANRALLTYPIIKPLDTLLARGILVIITYLVVQIFFYGMLITFDLAFFPAHIDFVIYAFLAVSLLGFSFGMLNAVLSSLWQHWSDVESVLTRPLFFISGIFYVPSLLPVAIRDWLKWNPILHLVEWVREGFYPNYNSLILDISYPLLLGVFLLFLSLFLERITRGFRE